MTPDDIKVSGLLTAEQVNDAWKLVVMDIYDGAEGHFPSYISACLKSLQRRLDSVAERELEAMHHELETQEQPVGF